MEKNYIISFPSSGNHLVRFFIELLNERPTSGTGNPLDIELYRNTYSEDIPFNIKAGSKDYIFYKDHSPIRYDNLNKLIFIVRNPKEILVKNSDYKYDARYFEGYFELIDFYNNYSGPKILFYYEDILINKESFIRNLYSFVGTTNLKKLEYCLQNIDKLYELSQNGTNRAWGGNNSSGNLNLYWNRTSEVVKKQVNVLIDKKKKTNKYNDIFDFYKL
jgi:hypothetical protein